MELGSVVVGGLVDGFGFGYVVGFVLASDILIPPIGFASVKVE